jgi:hypothetical protein
MKVMKSTNTVRGHERKRRSYSKSEGNLHVLLVKKMSAMKLLSAGEIDHYHLAG